MTATSDDGHSRNAHTTIPPRLQVLTNPCAEQREKQTHHAAFSPLDGVPHRGCGRGAGARATGAGCPRRRERGSASVRGCGGRG